jgi:hypothetical protein
MEFLLACSVMCIEILSIYLFEFTFQKFIIVPSPSVRLMLVYVFLFIQRPTTDAQASATSISSSNEDYIAENKSAPKPSPLNLTCIPAFHNSYFSYK